MATHYSMKISVEVSSNGSFESRKELESFLKDHLEENGGDVCVSVASFDNYNIWSDEELDAEEYEEELVKEFEIGEKSE